MPSPKRIESASVVMSMILEDLGLDSSNEVGNRQMWIRWIFQAQVGNTVPVAFETLQFSSKIENCSVRKPGGFVVLRQAVITGTGIDGQGFRVIPTYKPVAIGLVDKSVCQNPIICERNSFGFEVPQFDYQMVERDNSFEFSSNADGLTLEIEYKGYAIAEDGLPKVDMTFYEAIRAYCKMQWIQRCMMQGIGNLGHTDYAMAQRDWVSWTRRARVTQFYQDITQDAINRVMAMVNDPFYVNMNPYTIAENQRNLMRNHNGNITSNRWFPV